MMSLSVRTFQADTNVISTDWRSHSADCCCTKTYMNWTGPQKFYFKEHAQIFLFFTYNNINFNSLPYMQIYTGMFSAITNV